MLIEVDEKRVFQMNDRSMRKEGPEGKGEKSMLLPPLSDELVLSRIWMLLRQRVNVSLWHLRRVNYAWKRSVGESLQWSALEIVWVDSPGFMRYLREHGERRPSLRERVESEGIQG